MPVRRGYRQACGIARSLDIIGERWSLLIVRELLLGPKRFTDLRAGLPGASPNALTDRLAELTGSGVIRRRQLPPPAASWVLSIPARTEQTFLSIDSLMLNIRTYYTPPDDSPAAGILVRIADDSGTRTFGVWLDPDGAEVRHEPPEQPDAVITTDIPTLLRVLGNPDQLAKIPKRRLTISGDPVTVRRLVAGVTPPQPVR
jgi:DNA-binding HxlR family transcriptional regulator